MIRRIQASALLQGPLHVYCVEKIDKVNAMTKILANSIDQNRRYQTISNRLDVGAPPKLLPSDVFNTIGR